MNNCKQFCRNGRFEGYQPENGLIGSPWWPYRQGAGYIIPPKNGQIEKNLHPVGVPFWK